MESIGGVRRRDSAEGERERLKTKACHRWSLRVGVIVGKAEAKGEAEGETGGGENAASKKEKEEKGKESGLTFEKAWILSQVAQGGYL